MIGKLITRFDVLTSVKVLFLIPEMEVMTTKMVADYFGVDSEVIQRCYQRNRREIDSDGVMVKTVNDFGIGLNVQCQQTQVNGGIQFMTPEITFTIPYGRGTKVFPKRAILRIAMLLRDSEIAKEIRTQLLNTFENASDEQRVIEIDNEQGLLLDLARAYVARDFDGFACANQNYIAYQNRHIDELAANNKALAGDILTWTNRASLNRAVRTLAYEAKKGFGTMFNELYAELRYKHGIGLSQRGNQPYIQHIQESEWSNVIQSFSALCEEYGVSASSLLKKSKLKENVNGK